MNFKESDLTIAVLEAEANGDELFFDFDDPVRLITDKIPRELLEENGNDERNRSVLTILVKISVQTINIH